MILQRAQHVTKFGAIRGRIDRRLSAWEAGEFGMLVEDTDHLHIVSLNQREGGHRGEPGEDILQPGDQR